MEKADKSDAAEEPVSEPVCGGVTSPPGGESGVEDIASCTNHTRTYVDFLLSYPLDSFTHTLSLSLTLSLTLSLSLSSLPLSLSLTHS